MSIIINEEIQLRNKETIKKILTALNIDYKSTNNLTGGSIRVHTKGINKEEPFKFTNFVKNKQYNNLFDFLLNDEDNKRTEEEIKEVLEIDDEFFRKLRYKNNFTKEDMEKFKISNNLKNIIINSFVNIIEEKYEEFTKPSKYLYTRKLQTKSSIKEKTKNAFELNTDKIIDILNLLVTNLKDTNEFTKEFTLYKKLTGDKETNINNYILQTISGNNYTNVTSELKKSTVERLKKFPIVFVRRNNNDVSLKLRINEELNDETKYSIIGKTLPQYNENDFKNKEYKNVLITEGTSDFETIKLYMKENKLTSKDFINFGVHSAGYDFYKEIDILLDKTNIIIMGDNDKAGKNFEDKVKQFVRKSAILKGKKIPNIITSTDLNLFTENKEDINDLFNNPDKKDVFIEKIFNHFKETKNLSVIANNKFLFSINTEEISENMFIDVNKNYLFEDIEKHIKDNNYENNIPFLIGETYIDNVKKSIYTKVNKREFYKLIFAKNYDITNFLLNEEPIKNEKIKIHQEITIESLKDICDTTISRIEQAINSGKENEESLELLKHKKIYLEKESKIYDDIIKLDNPEYKNKVEKLISISFLVAKIAKENNMEINVRGSGNALYSLFYLGITSTNILENPFYDPSIFIKPGIKLPDVDLELNPNSIKKIVNILNEEYNMSLPLINKIIPKKINGEMVDTNGNTIHTSKYFSIEDILDETNVDDKLKEDIKKVKYLVSKGIELKYIPIRYKELEDSVNIDLISYGLNEKNDNIIDRRKSKINKFISMNDLLDNTNPYKLKENNWNELTHMTYGTKQIMKYIYDFETIQDRIQSYIGKDKKTYYSHSNLPHLIYEKDEKDKAINIKNILTINKDNIILDNDEKIEIESLGKVIYLSNVSKDDLNKKRFNSRDMSSIISLNRPLFNQNVFEIDGEKYTNVKTDLEFYLNKNNEIISNKNLDKKTINNMLRKDEITDITEDIVLIKSLNKDNVKVLYSENDYAVSSRYKRNGENTLRILNGENTIYDDENKSLSNEEIKVLADYNSLEEVGDNKIINKPKNIKANIEKRFLLKKFKENLNNEKVKLLPEYLQLTNGVVLYQDTLEAIINEISFSKELIKETEKTEEQLRALLLKYTTKPSKVKDKDRENTYKIINDIFTNKIKFNNLKNVEIFKELILPQLEVVIQSQPYFFKLPHAINLAEFYIINEVERRETILKDRNRNKILGLTKWKNGEGRYLNYNDENNEKKSLMIKDLKLIAKLENMDFSGDNQELLKELIDKINIENKKQQIRETTTNAKGGNLKNYTIVSITLFQKDFAYLNVQNGTKRQTIGISDKKILKDIFTQIKVIGLPEEVIKGENKNYNFKDKKIKIENIHYETYNEKLYMKGFKNVYNGRKSFDPTFP